MGLPLFDSGTDPGPSFIAFLNEATPDSVFRGVAEELAHATTVVSLRFADGVVMVGDRQATAGYIAERDVRKIAAADRYCALAISGTAATGLEFIRIAQLSFEHYEKMTGRLLSLEGKANYLSPLIYRTTTTTPFVVVPMLAGYDTARKQGRIFRYDRIGGCYEQPNFDVIGSGTPFAESTLRLGFREGMTKDEAINLAALAVYEAGDNDPSTGGPDFVRNIFPMIVTVTENGFEELAFEETSERFRIINQRRTASGGRAEGDLR